MNPPSGVVDAVRAFRAVNDAMGKGLSKVGETAFNYGVKRVNDMGATATRMANGTVSDQDVAAIGGVVAPVQASQSFKRFIKPSSFDEALTAIKNPGGVSLDEYQHANSIFERVKQEQLTPEEIVKLSNKPEEMLKLIQERLAAYSNK